MADAAPQIVMGFNEQTLVPGPSVVLKCAASGNPRPEIVWLLDKYLLVIDERFLFLSLFSYPVKCLMRN